MVQDNIILTGFMGCGKTTVGRLLAASLGYRFVDTDVLIEDRQGMSVRRIFSELGEKVFRRLERQVAGELAGESGLVIATGGKLLLDPANERALGSSGKIFCLTAEPEELMQRLSGAGAARRPLLQGPNAGRRITELMEERRQAYSRFPRVDTTGRSPEEVAASILAELSR